MCFTVLLVYVDTEWISKTQNADGRILTSSALILPVCDRRLRPFYRKTAMDCVWGCLTVLLKHPSTLNNGDHCWQQRTLPLIRRRSLCIARTQTSALVAHLIPLWTSKNYVVHLFMDVQELRSAPVDFVWIFGVTERCVTQRMSVVEKPQVSTIVKTLRLYNVPPHCSRLPPAEGYRYSSVCVSVSVIRTRFPTG